jgi:predicted transcriptional regulator
VYTVRNDVAKPTREVAAMSMSTESPKDKMIAILQKLPEDSTYDELLRELAFGRMVDRGLKDLDAGRIINNEEARRQIQSWQKQQ